MNNKKMPSRKRSRVADSNKGKQEFESLFTYKCYEANTTGKLIYLSY